MSIDKEEKRIRGAIDRSLGEWGVNRTTRDSFCDAAIDRALLYHGKARDSPLDFSTIKDQHLSTDPKEAINHVLKESIRETEEMGPLYWSITKDKLDLGFAPYFRKWDDQAKSFCFRLDKKFYRYQNSGLLDPFRRFSYVYYDTAAEYLAAQWDNPDAVGGYILVAMVACHLEHKATCFNCKKANTLRWNGGQAASSAWADVVCIACASTYEIKSKRDQDKVLNQLIKYDTIR